MLRALIAATFVLLVPVPAQDAPNGGVPAAPPAAGAVLAPCATCEGQGVTVLECEGCGGSGSASCVRCTRPVADLERELDRMLMAHREPEMMARMAEVMAKLDAVMADPAISRLLPGTLFCPAGCNRGWSMAGLQCQLCKGKGGHPCAGCKGKGIGRCWSCAGARKVAMPCPECSGCGKSPALEMRRHVPLGSCPWCGGEQLRVCRGCPEAGTEVRSCETCVGEGEVPCPTCAGTRSAPCKRCRSAGYMDFTKANRCGDCRGKGTARCDSCRRGAVTCEPCEGEGKSAHPCRACRGREIVPCKGCSRGVGRAWHVTAERLLVVGSRELGLAHLEHAIEREEARLEAELGSLELAAEDRRRRREVLDRERIQPLRRTLERARRN